MKLTFQDPVMRPRGAFKLQVFRRDRLIEQMAESNLVVNGARNVHALLLGGNVASNAVVQIGFGTGLLAPVAGNTGLTGAFLKALDSVTWPVAGQVTFAFSLAATEANGVAIGEFGLFTSAGVLYARKARNAALAKDSDIALAGTWTIIF